MSELGTPEIPLKGEKQGKQKNLAGKVIADKPDPLVVERARLHGDILDQIDRLKAKAKETYSGLQDAFKKSKRHRKVTIQTEWNVWTFWSEEAYKIKAKKELPVK